MKSCKNCRLYMKPKGGRTIGDMTFTIYECYPEATKRIKDASKYSCKKWQDKSLPDFIENLFCK